MTVQQSLFDIPPKEPSFGGRTFEPKLDEKRLTGQLGAVRDLMKDGRWRTLRTIAVSVRGSEAGISARLRDLRKAQFGACKVERRRAGDPRSGIWEYRMTK
jgi:hypothetical protein